MRYIARSRVTEKTVSASRREFLKMLGVSGAMASVPSSFGSLASLPDLPVVATQAEMAADPLRPQFHLLPERNWMNDPNGPIFWKGMYHMFFQYNPNAAVWGDMHWAHAVSPDMVHWKHMPMALAPTPGGYDADGCFSGSAVVFEGTPTIIYTGVKSVKAAEATLRDGTHNFLETQMLATSSDPDLRVWDKLAVPVLTPPQDPKITGFRDPFLWNSSDEWYMGVGSGQKGEGGRVLLYRSADLRKWEYLHPLAAGKKNNKLTKDPVDSGEMWECPDFFALGDKFVLLYSTEHKVYWETGELDPKELVFHSQKRGLQDHGTFYAPKSQLDDKARRVLWGWIPETRPEMRFRPAGWAGCMSLPRELTLDSAGNLVMKVLPEIDELRTSEWTLPGKEQGVEARQTAMVKMKLSEATTEIELHIAPKPFQMELSDGHKTVVSLVYDPAKAGQELQVGTQFASLPAADLTEHEIGCFGGGMHRERPGGGDRAGISGAEGKAAAGGAGGKVGGVEFADHLAAESDFGGPADELVGRSGLRVIPSGARNGANQGREIPHSADPVRNDEQRFSRNIQ
jgi:beta-fructofuranosidase